MFTGLIERTGTVGKFFQSGAFYTLTIEAENFSGELVKGQSVSVSGACLTVTRNDNKSFDVQMMRETFNRTWFNKFLRTGTKINLERAMKLTDRLDGHLVLGHVDGVAKLIDLKGTAVKEAVFAPDDKKLLRGIVEKGSVAIDGVSLTVINVNDKNFSVGLIPETLANTTLGNLKAGSFINLETDILGKYVARLTLSADRHGGYNSEKDSGNYLASLLEM
ncbi:MAG: riboflavin synthase [Synergistales bacterium]|nr:riboflavin synthase [Synergistales bacterium]MDY6401966.1 riboflavin synthase [Synergistales bacterium]MDY6405085.1 riboflavin synthase [Synergistales bacterium]MDY6410773.1 riboflavin synthase [Synergistales bacterium]MDY6414040.1 riboflavin synthase [Synergistales bacterium]